MKVVSGIQPKFKKAGPTSYDVYLDGVHVGRVGRTVGESTWWADRLGDLVSLGDFWPSRDAAARACIYFDS